MPYSREDLEFTAKKYGISVEEVERQIAAKEQAKSIMGGSGYQFLSSVGPGVTRGITGLLPYGEKVNELLNVGGEKLGVGPIAPQPRTPAEQYGQKFGQYIGLGFGTQGLAGALSTARNLQPTLRTILTETAQMPVSAQTAGSAAAGAGAVAANALFPGSPTAEIAGATAAPVAGGLAAQGAVRTALRGPGRSAQQNIQRRIANVEMAGITPDAQNLGVPGLSVASKVPRAVPGGITRMRASLDRTSEQIQTQLRNWARRLERAPEPVRAGRKISEGLHRWNGHFRLRWGQIDDGIRDAVRPDTPIQLTNFREHLAEESQRILGAEEFSDLLSSPLMRQMMQAAETTNTLPWAVMRQLRARIGRMAASTNPITGDRYTRAELNGMYAALSRDMEAALEAHSPQALQAFHRSNQYYRGGMERMKDFFSVVDNKKTYEDVYKWAMGGVKDGPTRIRTLRKSMSTEEWDSVLGTWMYQLGKVPPGERDAFGEGFSMARMLTGVAGVDRGARTPYGGAWGALFSGSRYSQASRDMLRLAKVAEQSKQVEKLLMNPSGTADRLAMLGTSITGAGGLYGAFSGSPEVLMSVATVMGASNISSRFLTSPEFVRWLARSTTVSPANMPQYVGRLSAAVRNSDPDIKESALYYTELVKELMFPEPENNGR